MNRKIPPLANPSFMRTSFRYPIHNLFHSILFIKLNHQLVKTHRIHHPHPCQLRSYPRTSAFSHLHHGDISHKTEGKQYNARKYVQSFSYLLSFLCNIGHFIGSRLGQIVLPNLNHPCLSTPYRSRLCIS